MGYTPAPLQRAIGAPDVTVVGVWDTVDAYGMPIDELTLAWDYFIHTLRFPDLNLPPNVNKAYHALAIDDERQTFHPTLWNEEGLPDHQTIEQVWFSGAHSNVGGGYAKDELAMVALDWMMGNVEKPGHGSKQGNQEGLRFIKRERERIKHSRYAHGHLYDARAGLGAYYRLKPRNIDKLCHDPNQGVEIPIPKIHESVFERIQRGGIPYAPLGLPVSYEVAPSGKVYETPGQAQNRANVMEKAWDVIGWRRILYFAFVVASLLLVGSKFFLKWEPEGPCDSAYCVLDPILHFLTTFIPDFVAGWIEALRQNPSWLMGFLLVFIVFSRIKHVWYTKTSHLSQEAWKPVKKKIVEEPKAHVEVPSTLTYKIRTNPVLITVYQNWFAKKALPALCMVVMVLVPILLVSRIAFEVRTTAGGICEAPATNKTLVLGESQSIAFSTKSPCHPAGIMVQKGEQYRIVVEVQEPWKDGADVEAGPNGLAKVWDSVKLALAVPARRSWSAPWFSLLGRVGANGKDRFEIGQEKIFTGKTDGPLFLFVNDAVCGWCLGDGWALPYVWGFGENQGTANITITHLPTTSPFGGAIFATPRDDRY